MPEVSPALGKSERGLTESRGTKEMLWISAAKQWKREGKRQQRRQCVCVCVSVELFLHAGSRNGFFSIMLIKDQM